MVLGFRVLGVFQGFRGLGVSGLGVFRGVGIIDSRELTGFLFVPFCRVSGS